MGCRGGWEERCRYLESFVGIRDPWTSVTKRARQEQHGLRSTASLAIISLCRRASYDWPRCHCDPRTRHTAILRTRYIPRVRSDIYSCLHSAAVPYPVVHLASCEIGMHQHQHQHSPLYLQHRPAHTPRHMPRVYCLHTLGVISS